MKATKQIYLDHAATTPLDRRVFFEMEPYFSDKFGNPSSVHKSGYLAREQVLKARKNVAKVLNCSPSEIIFTSGGTESNNLALKGVAEARNFKGHIITTKIEHSAVLESAKNLEKLGVKVTYISPDKLGIINPLDVEKAIQKDTFLISVIYANNEIGVVEPISAIGKIARKNNILMHTDAVQAPGLLSLDVKKLNIDLLSLSGHKFYAPKGTGILYAGNGIEIKPQNSGGGQEFKLRSGTENVPGIIGISKALFISESERKKQSEQLKILRDFLIKEILDSIDGVILTGHPSNRLSNNASFCFKNIEGDVLVMRLSERGFEVSSGSACSSENSSDSHVLRAIKVEKSMIKGSIRVSLGRTTTKKDLEAFSKVLKEEVLKSRKIK